MLDTQEAELHRDVMNLSQLPPTLAAALSHCSPEKLLNLSCQHRPDLWSGSGAADGESPLVCDSPPGDRSVILQATLISITVLTVTMMLLVNVLTIMTLYRTRKLHTLMNSLVGFICLANLPLCLSSGLNPYLVNHRVQMLCQVRHVALTLAHNAAFITVVAITVLRYLMVVCNKSYAATRRNVALALAAPLLFSAAACVLIFDNMYSKCGDTFGRTTKGFVIVINRPAKTSTSMLIGIGLQYSIGLLVMAFCHARILAKTLDSRRKLRAHRSNRLKHFSPRPAAPRSDNVAEKQETPLSHKAAKLPRTSDGGINGVDTSVWLRRTSSVKHGSTLMLPSTTRSVLPEVDQVDSTAAAAAVGEASNKMAEAAAAAGANSAGDDQTSVSPQIEQNACASKNGTSTSTSQIMVSPSTSVAALGPSASTSASASASCIRLDTSRSPLAPLTLRIDRLFNHGSHRGLDGHQRGTAPAEHRRVDVVATAALLCCMAVYLLAYGPFVAFILAERSMDCLLMPPPRLLSWILFNCSTGLSAVLNPLIFVIFNGEFRHAFGRTCQTALRR